MNGLLIHTLLFSLRDYDNLGVTGVMRLAKGKRCTVFARRDSHCYNVFWFQFRLTTRFFVFTTKDVYRLESRQGSYRWKPPIRLRPLSCPVPSTDERLSWAILTVFKWEYREQRAVRMKQWKAYQDGDDEWELYDLADDIQEKRNIAADHPDILKELIAYAQAAHEPVRPGEIYDRDVIQKDRRQAPHHRK